MPPCNCTTSSPAPSSTVPVNPSLPSLDDLSAACATDASCTQDTCLGSTPASITAGPVCSDPNAIRSTASCGFTLPTGYTDAINDNSNSGVTLLGRIGSKLAKLSGNGFIQVVNGLAFVVSSVRLRVTDLWHEWWRPAGINTRPVIGTPYDFPYQVIADSDGVLHAIKGLSGEGITHDSIQVWDLSAGAWVTRQVADFPILKRGLLPTLTELELVGFAPIATSGSSDDVRQLSRLQGSGILIIEQQATIDSSCACEGCTPVPAVSSVARFLANPTEDGTYSLKVVVTDGEAVHQWVED
jgi:hypothetical protein